MLIPLLGWLLACSAYTTLKIEALHCSEISVAVYQIMQLLTVLVCKNAKSECLSSAIAKAGPASLGQGIVRRRPVLVYAPLLVNVPTFPGCTCRVTPTIQRLFCSWDAL